MIVRRALAPLKRPTVLCGTKLSSSTSNAAKLTQARPGRHGSSSTLLMARFLPKKVPLTTKPGARLALHLRAGSALAALPAIGAVFEFFRFPKELESGFGRISFEARMVILISLRTNSQGNWQK